MTYLLIGSERYLLLRVVLILTLLLHSIFNISQKLFPEHNLDNDNSHEENRHAGSYGASIRAGLGVLA